jgi:TetR/AcrR family transcriptional regulator, repressor for uid operon
VPKVSKEHKQARREKIIDAAINCFIREGIYRTSMRDICKEAGMSTGAVYLHFKSKDAIIEATRKMNRAASRKRYETGMKTGSALGAIRSWSESFDAKLKNPDKAWQLYPQLLAEAFRSQQIRENIIKDWGFFAGGIAGALQQGIGEGSIKPDVDPRMVGRLWAVVADGIIFQRLIDPEQEAGEIIRFYRMLLESYCFVEELDSKKQR